jgi:signal transduction histidine kinase
VALAFAAIVALDVALALSGESREAVLGVTLVCALLAVVARFMRRARESEARMALVVAQLEDAREEQARSAAAAERARIAAELHDVLAHTLSGAAIQLQTARKFAQREEAGEGTRAAIDRAGELVGDGLMHAREAVGALKGDRLPGPGELGELVERFRRDTHADVTLTVEGTPVRLNADAGLALYRGTQEALTNIARYAPGAATDVVLRYADGRASVSIEDRVAVIDGAPATDPALAEAGGGHGLAGLRMRIAEAGGAMHAGPTPTGWRVDLEVPG